MTQRSRSTLKGYFNTGDVPTETNFSDMIDSFALAAELPVSVKSYGATGDGTTDDTTAIQNALNAEKCIYFPPGNYVASNLSIALDGTTIFGAGQQSVITFKTGSTGFLFTCSTYKVVIEHLRLSAGAASQKGTTSSGSNRSAISMSTQIDSLVCNCSIFGFANYAIYANDASRDHVSHARFHSINVENCWTGFLLGANAEYISLSDVSCKYCYIGAEVTAGNVTVCNSQFVQCGIGFWVRKNGNTNNSHGNANGCLFNHCTTSIFCDGVDFGFNFVGCQVFEGLLIIDDSVGVNINSGVLDPSEVRMSGGGRNYIRHNYNPAGYASTITHDYGAVADDTEFEGNYRANGTAWS